MGFTYNISFEEKIYLNELEFLGIDANAILNHLVECGKVDIVDTQMQIERMKNEKYLNMHNHKIWQREDGKWNTYLDDENSPRGYSLKVRKSREDIEKLICKFYKDKEDDPYLKDVFMEWNQSGLDEGAISIQSYVKYENDFKRYFTDDCILCQKKMRLITEADLELHVKGTIRKFDMTSKIYANMRTILRGILKYAKRKGYTNISMTHFFGDLEISRNSFRKKVVVRENEVFDEAETELVTSYLRERATIRDLGLLLAFETGLRVGELSALKHCDITQDKKEIHVQRSEITYKDLEKKSVCTVRDFPKTDAGERYVAIPEQAQHTLDAIIQLNPDGEYLFSENGKRIRSNAFNRRIDRVCDALKIPRRSMHKIRKTYGTTLIDNGVDDDVITEQMGHKNISTTRKYYYFSTKRKEKKFEQINKAVPC